MTRALVDRGLAWMLVVLVACAGGDEAPAPDEEAESGSEIAAPGQLVPVRLAAPDSAARFGIETSEPGLLDPIAFFPPPEVGRVSFVVTTTGGDTIDIADGVPEPAGAYTVEVRGEHASDRRFHVKVDLVPPLDPHEPNDVREDAAEIALPFFDTIQLHGGDDVDWFAFDAPDGGAIGIHLMTIEQFEGPVVTVTDSAGRVLYESPTDPWGYRGMRYLPSTGGRHYVAIEDRRGRDPLSEQAFADLEIRHYAPDGRPIGSPGIIAVGVEEDTVTMNQLRAVARGLGTEVVSAVTAEDIAAALETAAEEPDRADGTAAERGTDGGNRLLLILAGLAALIVATGAFVFVRRSRAD